MAPFLPGHDVQPPIETDYPGARPFGQVSAAPYGSALILPISWAYIKLMGADALRSATQVTQQVVFVAPSPFNKPIYINNTQAKLLKKGQWALAFTISIIYTSL